MIPSVNQVPKIPAKYEKFPISLISLHLINLKLKE